MEMGFIFIHGQDHLMTTILLRDIVDDFINLYEERGKNNVKRGSLSKLKKENLFLIRLHKIFI